MHIKVLILGDSISEGLGSKKYNYSDMLKEKLFEYGIEITIMNLAYSGTTIKYIESIKNEILKFNPDISIIFYGNVDGMLRPDINHKPNYYNYLPTRYKKNGMLNPRPFYSSDWNKKIIQLIDSFIRTSLNKILLKIQGSYTWVSLDSFKSEYFAVLRFLVSIDSSIICTSTVCIDEKFFPGTSKSYEKYNMIIQKASQMIENTYYLDIFNIFKKYKMDDVFLSDHFHPSIEGYKILANEYSSLIFQICKNGGKNGKENNCSSSW